MSEKALDAAIAALARADLPGQLDSAETLLRRAALRRQLERAGRGAVALENGLPAVVAGVCAVAIGTLLAISPGLSPGAMSAGALALLMLVLAAVTSSVQLFSRR